MKREGKVICDSLREQERACALALWDESESPGVSALYQKRAGILPGAAALG